MWHRGGLPRSHGDVAPTQAGGKRRCCGLTGARGGGHLRKAGGLRPLPALDQLLESLPSGSAGGGPPSRRAACRPSAACRSATRSSGASPLASATVSMVWGAVGAAGCACPTTASNADVSCRVTPGRGNVPGYGKNPPSPGGFLCGQGRIEPWILPLFRRSWAYTNVFQPVRPDARPAFGRVGSVGLARWPHIGPMR